VGRAPHHAIEPDAATSALLSEARRARRAGETRRALAIYERLVAGGGPLAESALFEVAAIEDEDLHQPARALETWQRYRARHPRGLLRAEADLSIIEVLPRLGQEARALEEARAFLRRYPRNERRGEVARVAGDLSRARGDCPAALALYETALGSSLGSHDADDVAFGRAACLAAVGDLRAPEAVRSYRARFPGGRHASEAARLSAP
jgi:tetratricopeptide (TPR) repeat protein